MAPEGPSWQGQIPGASGAEKPSLSGRRDLSGDGAVKILIDHTGYRSDAPGGEDRVVDQEIESLRSGGHEARLFHRSNDEIAGFSALRKVAVPFASVWHQGPEAAADQFGPIANRAQLESIYRFAIEHPTWREREEPKDAPIDQDVDPADGSHA